MAHTWFLQKLFFSKSGVISHDKPLVVALKKKQIVLSLPPPFLLPCLHHSFLPSFPFETFTYPPIFKEYLGAGLFRRSTPVILDQKCQAFWPNARAVLAACVDLVVLSLGFVVPTVGFKELLIQPCSVTFFIFPLVLSSQFLKCQHLNI